MTLFGALPPNRTQTMTLTHSGASDLGQLMEVATAAVTVRKDDAPAASQAAMTNVVGLGSVVGGGGLIQTTSG